MNQSILILSSGKENLEPLREAFQVEVRPEDEVHLVPTFKELIAQLRDRRHHSLVVLPGLPARSAGGRETLARLRQADPDVPIVIAADRGSIEQAAQAIAGGANDFLV